MKPVAVIQHDAIHRPGFLLEFLDLHGVASRTYRAGQGDTSRLRADDFSGIVVLGSNSSANDPEPWIDDELALIDDALHRDVPVLGHSFGGRLLARAMGAEVRRASAPDIGWSALHVTPRGKPLFDDAAKVMAFNWHRETFSIPEGATRTLFGKYTLNEGYACGRHLAFQCHLEMTAEMVREWCRIGKSELRHADGGAAQGETEILARLPLCMPMLQRAAQAVYGHWLSGVQAHACEE
jgi:GMP synthase-like glutamine amidotransferase